jgi:acetyltransferase-like isoleucine patch superfamily enzyme
MKTILQKIIRLRNPRFRFDEGLNDTALLSFVIMQVFSLLRGLKLLLFLKSPKGILLGNGVRFFNVTRIHWGKYVRLGDNVFISALGKGHIHIGDSVGIGAFSRIVISSSLYSLGESIRIGRNVGIGEFAYLGGAGGLEIGDECIVGQYFSCHPENHVFSDTTVAYRFQATTRKGIKVGKNCWIGSKVTLLDGVTIGDNCVIAAGSVVTKSMPSNTVIGGVPAKILKYTTGTLNAA